MAKKKQELSGVKVHTLSTGYQFTAKQTNSMLIYDAQEQFKFPDVPKIQIKQGGQTMWIDNSSDPSYVERMDDIGRKRNMAALSCVIQNGVKLVGGVPEDRAWLRKVRRMVDLSLYEDENGDISGEDLEYLFLRYVAIASADDYALVFSAATLTEEAVQEVAASFPGDAEGE